MTKQSTNHEFGTAASTSIRHAPRSCHGQSGFRRSFENGRRPPKILLRIANYFRHKIDEGEGAYGLATQADSQTFRPPSSFLFKCLHFSASGFSAGPGNYYPHWRVKMPRLLWFSCL